LYILFDFHKAIIQQRNCKEKKSFVRFIKKNVVYTCVRSFINISILFRMNVNKHILQNNLHFCLYVNKNTYLWSVAIMQQNKNKKQNIMKNAINTIKKTDSTTLIGLTFVCIIFVPCLILVISNILSGAFSHAF